MPIKKQAKFEAWSMSRLNDWRECPAKAKFKHLDKLKEPFAPAMQRGTDIHAKAALCVREPEKTKLAEELERFIDEFDDVRLLPDGDKQTELQWAFNSSWTLLPSFFDSGAWVRMILDLRYKTSSTEVTIVDHKTGKVYEKNREQNKLYALGEFMASPTTEVVKTELWYLDQGEIVEDRYTRDQVKELTMYWDKESRGIMRDTEFKPTPNSKCKWCHFAKSKGGPCTAEE